MPKIDNYGSFDGDSSGAHYRGTAMACPECASCDYYFYERGNSHPYACMNATMTESIAAQKSDGRIRYDKCKAYEPKKAGQASASANARIRESSGPNGPTMKEWGGNVMDMAGMSNKGPSMGQWAGKQLDNAGLGLVTSAAGLAAKGIAAGINALQDSEEDKAQRVNDMWEKFNKANFSDTQSTIKGISRLFGVFDDAYSYGNDSVYLENRQEIADAALSKIEQGIAILRGPEGDSKKADEFQIKLQKTKLKKLEIKPDTGIFESTDEKAVAYNRNITIINSVSFEGGSKLAVKSLDSLFKIAGSLFGLLGDGKLLQSYEKRKLCDSAALKIREGIETLRQDSGFDQKKTVDYETDLQKMLANRNGIKPGEGEEFDQRYMQDLIDNVLLDYGAIVIAAGVDSLLSISGKGKDIYSNKRRKLYDTAAVKIRQGIELLRQDSGFEQKKITGYEKDLEKLLVHRNEIKLAQDEEFDEDYAQNLIDNVLLDYGDAVIVSGIDSLFSLQGDFFSFIGKGKEIFSEPKRKLCDGAIGKIRGGIELLKKEPGFDEKKLAKYESELAEFQQKRDGIQKSMSEKNAEKNAEIKRQYAEQGEKMKQEFSAIGGQFKDAFSKNLGGLGSIFGKKDSAADGEEKTAGGMADKLKQGLGGIGGILGKKETTADDEGKESEGMADKLKQGLGGLGGLFGKKK